MSGKLVRDLMHIGVANCRADTPLVDVVRTLLHQGLESIIVLDDNGYAIGVFGREDAVSSFGQGMEPGQMELLPVSEWMQTEIPEILPDLPIVAAAQLMLDWKVRAAFVIHHHAGGVSWPAAVLRFEDIMRYVSSESESEIENMGVGAPRKTPMEKFRERYGKTD